MKNITYEAYVKGTDLKAEFVLPENATFYEKRFEAREAILRTLEEQGIRYRKITEDKTND